MSTSTSEDAETARKIAEWEENNRKIKQAMRDQVRLAAEGVRRYSVLKEGEMNELVAGGAPIASWERNEPLRQTEIVLSNGKKVVVTDSIWEQPLHDLAERLKREAAE